MATQSIAEQPSAVSKCPKSPKSDAIKVPKKVYILLRGMNGEVTRINLNVYDDASSADGKPVWVTLTVRRLIELLSECLHSNKKREKLLRDSQDNSGVGLSDSDEDKKFDCPTPVQLLEILKLDENGVMSAVMKNALARTCVHFFVDNGSEAHAGRSEEDNARYRLIVFDDDGNVADFRDLAEAEKNDLITDFLVKPDTDLSAKTDAELASMYVHVCKMSTTPDVSTPEYVPVHVRTQYVRAHGEDHLLLILFHVVDAQVFLKNARAGIPEASYGREYYSNILLLHFPLEFGYLALLNCLLSATQEVNEKNRKGETALHLAARRGRVEVVEALVRAGADIDAVDNLGKTALYASVCHFVGSCHFMGSVSTSRLEMVKILINNNADVNIKGPPSCSSARGPPSCTALHYILEYPGRGDGPSCWQTEEIVESLTNGGADVNAKDNLNRTPLDILIDRIRWKSRTNWRRWGELVPWAIRHCSTLLSHLLSAGAKLTERNESGVSVLIDIKDSKDELAQWILKTFS